jgi:hypothetical protein
MLYQMFSTNPCPCFITKEDFEEDVEEVNHSSRTPQNSVIVREVKTAQKLQLPEQENQNKEKVILKKIKKNKVESIPTTATVKKKAKKKLEDLPILPFSPNINRVQNNFVKQSRTKHNVIVTEINKPAANTSTLKLETKINGGEENRTFTKSRKVQRSKQISSRIASKDEYEMAKSVPAKWQHKHSKSSKIYLVKCLTKTKSMKNTAGEVEEEIQPKIYKKFKKGLLINAHDDEEEDDDDDDGYDDDDDEDEDYDEMATFVSAKWQPKHIRSSKKYLINKYTAGEKEELRAQLIQPIQKSQKVCFDQ